MPAELISTEQIFIETSRLVPLTCSTQRAALRLKAKGNISLYLYNSFITPVNVFFIIVFIHRIRDRAKEFENIGFNIMKSMYHKRETIKSSSGVKELENDFLKCNDIKFQTIYITMLEINLFVSS